MGWWSTDVLGGDTPLDALDDIDQVLKAGELYPFDDIANPDEVRNAIIVNLPLLLERLGGDNIALQVLGALSAHVGAPLPEDARQRLVKAALADEWASDDEERAKTMRALINAVDALKDGMPTRLRQRGLFTALFFQ